MKANRLQRLALAVTLVTESALIVNHVARPAYLRWGSTAAERERAMLLDEAVAAPMLNSTMAISIDAAPEDVWPWLVQMGDPPRAGYYSYTWIERWAGMNIQNGDQVLPQFQHLEPGNALDVKGTMTVLAVDEGKELVLGPPAGIDWLKSTWAFGVYPTQSGSTRLVTRVRARWSWPRMLKNSPPFTWPLYLLIEPGAFVMERKMLIEIKRRAERLAASRLPVRSVPRK